MTGIFSNVVISESATVNVHLRMMEGVALSYFHPERAYFFGDEGPAVRGCFCFLIWLFVSRTAAILPALLLVPLFP